MPNGEVRVFERRFARDAFGGVEREEVGEEVKSLRVGTGE